MKKWVIACAAIVLVGCGEEPPKTLNEISKSIVEVSTLKLEGADALVFGLKPDLGYDNSTYFFMATQEANRILPKLVKYFPDQKPSQVAFTLNAALVDKFGNESKAPIIQLVFSMADIQRINYEKGQFTSWDLLELSNIEFLHPAGIKVVRDYCAGDNNAEYAAVFCRRFI